LSEAKKDFEPRIVGFLCNWCSYAAADLCGVSRYQYPTNVRIIRVMCSARVEPAVVLEMFLSGADAVFVGGCHIGDCHYISGNFFAKRRMSMLRVLLERAGIDSRRLRLEWISASEGKRFADVMTEFQEEVKGLGPSPVRGNKELLENMHLAKKVASDFRLRALTTKGYKVVEEGNVYGRNIPEELYDAMMVKAIDDEFSRAKILYTTSKEPRSVPDISQATGLEPKKVLEHVVDLKEMGLLAMTSIEGKVPYYKAMSAVDIPEGGD
jgi:coenzyme F420-reducing hydrogenase delta subunit